MRCVQHSLSVCGSKIEAQIQIFFFFLQATCLVAAKPSPETSVRVSFLASVLSVMEMTAHHS